MASYTVKLIFNDGSGDYQLQHVQSVTDNIEGTKSTVIEGVRGDGSVVIPGGKKSHTITIEGLFFDNDGFTDLMSEMNTMRTSLTSNQATLSMKHWNGASWVDDWAYTVRRIDPVQFGANLRTETQQYTVSFLVIAY